jgi:hypothetical protein
MALNGLRANTLASFAQLLTQVKEWVASPAGEEVRMIMAVSGGDEPPVSPKKFNEYVDTLSLGPNAHINWCVP